MRNQLLRNSPLGRPATHPVAVVVIAVARQLKAPRVRKQVAGIPTPASEKPVRTAEPLESNGRRHVCARVAVLGLTATAATLLGAGSAFAYFSATNTTGSGSATTASAPSITVSHPTLSASLYPGASVDLTVTLTNNSNQAWAITGLMQNGTPTGGGACSGSNVNVTGTYTFPATTVAANSSTSVTFTGAVTMRTTAPSTCQTQSFNVPVSVTGKIG